MELKLGNMVIEIDISDGNARIWRKWNTCKCLEKIWIANNTENLKKPSASFSVMESVLLKSITNNLADWKLYFQKRISPFEK